MGHRFPLLFALLGTAALAEKAPLNLHLDLAVGPGFDSSALLTGASLKVDTTLLKALGPVAPQVELFGLSATSPGYLQGGALFGAGLGARLRLFDDERGYLFNPGTTHTGNLWGNLWVDAHVTWNSGGFGPGFDLGAGAELSVIEGLSIGPFVKFEQAGAHSLGLAGLSFTVGAPQVNPAYTDSDHDGLRAADDQCPDEPEDYDGFEDGDGCPDKDNDHDGIEDSRDQCPNEPEDKDGIADEDGCPETDADADGVLDEEDACPLVKGPAANEGCPDVDSDGDGLVDRLDACPQVSGTLANAGCAELDVDGDGVFDRLDACPKQPGPPENAGCPWPDADADGVIDPLDNCPGVGGPADNQGCPLPGKQLVVLGLRTVTLSGPPAFGAASAALRAGSRTMLDQLAAVLEAHPERALLSVHASGDGGLWSERARAVIAALISRGVGEGRLGVAASPAAHEPGRVEFSLTTTPAFAPQEVGIGAQSVRPTP